MNTRAFIRLYTSTGQRRIIDFQSFNAAQKHARLLKSQGFTRTRKNARYSPRKMSFDLVKYGEYLPTERL